MSARRTVGTRGMPAVGIGIAVLAVVQWSSALAAPTADATRPGAYCPLPEKGEVPRCLDTAQEAYGAFFSALDADAPADADAALATVEDAVARGADDAQAYLALSSLTYGYYRLAQRAAASDDADPEIARRLARWNDLLALAWRRSDEDEPYRTAVRRAAEDLSERAPIRLPCRDDRGEQTECRSTESVLRGIHAASDEVGIRGALGRLLRRVFGGGSS